MRSLVVVMLLAACQQAPSKLDGLEATTPPPAPPASAGPAASGDVEARLARVEAQLKKYAEPLDFLSKVYAQQKAQQGQQEREEPAPDAVFAVDIAADLKAGQVEGPSSAEITIVEAWDFA